MCTFSDQFSMEMVQWEVRGVSRENFEGIEGRGMNL